MIGRPRREGTAIVVVAVRTDPSDRPARRPFLPPADDGKLRWTGGLHLRPVAAWRCGPNPGVAAVPTRVSVVGEDPADRRGPARSQHITLGLPDP